jgi:hypothetical protein
LSAATRRGPRIHRFIRAVFGAGSKGSAYIIEMWLDYAIFSESGENGHNLATQSD